VNRLIAELVIFGILLGSAIFCWHEWQSARIDLTEYKATVAAVGAAQAQAVHDREAAQEAANAATYAQLQAHLADSDSRAADLSGRLRQALSRIGTLSATQDIGPITVPARVTEGPGGVERALTGLAQYDAACQRDAARLGALQQEIRGQL
jgi:hypothetical protein